ncbi:MAG TPA: hypothetical protein PK191_05790 [Niabella sp.]|nr:hypothetical protein [Niabella sp.]HOZ96019.1 hypothetical protein [Niabella sp.]HQW15486.1 hypothetical protein [Niabella sp.]HQX20628.1 hypothetical protein [Niabella sp.]HQX40504.1 hypothetical protein [Niabella sp.]
MKTLFISAAFLLSIAFNASATNADPSNDKVAKTFKLLFKNASNVVWSHADKFYSVSFTKASVSTRAMFDKQGQLVQTIRYYKESNLPANVLYNVKKNYAGMEVWGVTELSNDHGINYRIVLKDKENYTQIKANDAGEIELVQEFERGDR